MPENQIAVIGTIDSSGGAGINQDIRVAALFGHKFIPRSQSEPAKREWGGLIHPLMRVSLKRIYLCTPNKALRL